MRLLNDRVLFGLGFGLFEEKALSFLKMIFYMNLFVLEGNNSDSVIVATKIRDLLKDGFLLIWCSPSLFTAEATVEMVALSL